MQQNRVMPWFVRESISCRPLGLRLFGGHSPRLAGLTAMLALGVIYGRFRPFSPCVLRQNMPPRPQNARRRTGRDRKMRRGGGAKAAKCAGGGRGRRPQKCAGGGRAKAQMRRSGRGRRPQNARRRTGEGRKNAPEADGAKTAKWREADGAKPQNAPEAQENTARGKPAARPAQPRVSNSSKPALEERRRKKTAMIPGSMTPYTAAGSPRLV